MYTLCIRTLGELCSGSGGVPGLDDKKDDDRHNNQDNDDADDGPLAGALLGLASGFQLLSALLHVALSTCHLHGCAQSWWTDVASLSGWDESGGA